MGSKKDILLKIGQLALAVGSAMIGSAIAERNINKRVDAHLARIEEQKTEDSNEEA